MAATSIHGDTPLITTEHQVVYMACNDNRSMTHDRRPDCGLPAFSCQCLLLSSTGSTVKGISALYLH